MHQDPLIFRILATVGLVAFLVFIAIFSREPWRRNVVGVMLMVMSIGVAGFEVASTLRQWLGPEYPGRQAVRIVSQFFVIIPAIVFSIVVVRMRRRDRHIVDEHQDHAS